MKPSKKKKAEGELIFGLHPVIEMLRAKKRKVIALYTTKPTPKGWQQVEQELPKYPVPIQYVVRDVLARMVSTTDHQGVVAWVQSIGFRKKPFEPDKHPFLIMVDGVQDPRNLGAILRSAYCTGVDGVIIPQKGNAPLNAVAYKAAAGLAEHLEIYQPTQALTAAQELKKNNYALYLATLEGENALEVTFKKPCCLVIGGEGFGISKNILSLGHKITLPQRTKDISYNASVAAGILLFLASFVQKD